MLEHLNSTMTEAERELLYHRALARTSLDRQVGHLHEEEAELTCAIAARIRERVHDNQNIIEEIADVLVMLDEMRVLFSISTEEIKSAVDTKLAKFCRQVPA